VVDVEWECKDCGYVLEGEKAPQKCPDCGAIDSWEKVEYVDEWDHEDDDGQEEPAEPDWECVKCGHGVEGQAPPLQCPDCGAADAWTKVEYIDWDEEDTDEQERPAEPDWECLECGCGFEGAQPPRQCPDCGSADAWAKVEYIETWTDEEEESEEEGRGGEKSAPHGWECVECGYFFEGTRPANSCPDCGAVDAWEEADYRDPLPGGNADPDR